MYGMNLRLLTLWSWQRIVSTQRDDALHALVNKNGFLPQVKAYTPVVNKIVDHVNDSVREVAKPTQEILSFISESLNTEILAGSIVSLALPDIELSPDACLLLVILHLLGSPTTFEFLAGSVRERLTWNHAGNLTASLQTILAVSHALRQMLQDKTRLRATLDELCKCDKVIRTGPAQLYEIEPITARKLTDKLSTISHRELRFQALCLTTRSVPWKYAEKK